MAVVPFAVRMRPPFLLVMLLILQVACCSTAVTLPLFLPDTPPKEFSMSDFNTLQAADLESVLRRVQKLLAIANDDRANPAEAAAAASQAEKIMRKYQIEHADVISASLARDDSFDQQDISGTMNPQANAKSSTTWGGMLALAIGCLHDCKASWARTIQLGVCLRYSGYKSDTQVALWTHLYVVNQMSMALRQHQKEYGCDRQDSERFRKGFVIAVVASIEKIIQAKRAEMAEASSSQALVLVKAQAVAERFGEQKQRRSNFQVGGNAFQQGRAAGQRVDIGRRGVSASAPAAARLN